MKKNKLYTANRWNQPAFMVDRQRHNIFDGFTWGQSSQMSNNPFGVNLDMKIGYGGFSLYMRGAITPLLNKDVAPKCFPLTIGMGIGL